MAVAQAEGLLALEQTDFSLGAVRSVARGLIPPNGAYDIVNGLLDDTGSVYRRGGSAYLSTADFGSALTFLWDGQLLPGARTLFASGSSFGALDGSDSPVTLGGGGLTVPARASVLGGIVFVDGGTMWAGSRKTAPYSTGTVSVTNGSTTVVGSGTTWNTLVDAGMLFRISGERAYVVKSITDTTHLELADPYEGTTGTGKTYALKVTDTALSPYMQADVYAVVANRLLVGAGNRVYESDGPSPTGVLRPHSIPATNYHELPLGATVLGIFPNGPNALVFSTAGIFQITNVALDLTDDAGNMQQQLHPSNSELLMWSKAGAAVWGNAVVAPCTDGVWLVDGTSAPRLLSRSITPLIADYVQAGYRCGQGAVYRSHLFLPILDATANWVDALVCRLDRPVRTPYGEMFPWTRLAGSGAQAAAFTVRVGTSVREPKLLAASRKTAGRVTDCSAFFTPTAARKNDADGTTHNLDITTKDYPAGMVRFVRARYELEDAAADQPTLSLSYAQGRVAATGARWDQAVWDTDTWADPADTADETQLAGLAPTSDGRLPFTWMVNRDSQQIRYRLRSQGPSAWLAVRSLTQHIRPTARP